MKIRNLLILSALCAFIPVCAIAQPKTVERFGSTQSIQPLLKPLRLDLSTNAEAPELFPGENADVGPQRILRLVPRRKYLEAVADSQYLYTDNGLLSAKPVTSTTEFVNTISAAYAPTPRKLGDGRFAPGAGYMSQWYNYGLGGHDVSALDFNVQTVFLNAKYLMPNNWQLFGEFDYNRLLSQPSYSEFYNDFVPSLGIQRLFQINDNTLFSASLQTDYHFSDTKTVFAPTPTSINDRWENTLSLSLSYQVMPKLVVQPYYRFMYSYYPTRNSLGSGRNDYLNSVGLSAAYYFTPGLSLRAFVNYDARESDESDGSVPKYRDYTVGLNLSYTVRF